MAACYCDGAYINNSIKGVYIQQKHLNNASLKHLD